MRRILVLLVFLTLVACSSPGLNSHSDPDVSRTAFTVREVVFTPSGWPEALKGDVYQPRGSGPWPGVLLLYGGSWSEADNRWHMKLLARKLASRGFVVLNASYRGGAGARYPAPVDDLRHALRWFRAHAGELALNPSQVGAYGFSAGGHLAGCLATMDAPPEARVQAVVTASAPHDLALYPGGNILPRFLGATYAENAELFRSASPINHVTRDDPPFFMYHGTDDKTVSPEHSQRMKAALDRAGVANELILVPRRGHATMLIFGGAEEDAAIAFLSRVLR